MTRFIDARRSEFGVEPMCGNSASEEVSDPPALTMVISPLFALSRSCMRSVVEHDDSLAPDAAGFHVLVCGHDLIEAIHLAQRDGRAATGYSIQEAL